MKKWKVLFAIGCGLIVAACGGGGGGGSATPTTPTSTTLTVTGTAATGLAIPGATVTGKCKVGTGTAATLADGSYTLTITDGQLPCVLEITNPVDGVKLHTVVTGTSSTATANITPLTEMATARVLGSEPNVFFAAFDAAVATQRITTTTVQAAQADIGLVLTGIVDTTALGNFISVPLKAATQGSPTTGDAHDKLLDSLKLKLSNAQIGTVATALASNQTTDAIKQTVASMINAPTMPPVANAGAAQSVVASTTVTLDASTSSAAAGKSLTYAWIITSKPAGSAATLVSPTTAKPTFVADVSGLYVASVIVNDGTTASSASAVTITASAANAAPIANAGVAQNVVAGSLVTLDGSASSDANGDPLTYAWKLTSKPAGSAAVLSSATSVKPTFTADVAGTYVGTLIVNDGRVDSTAVSGIITAAVANAAPIANAGVAQNVVAGSVVTLDGSASSDANGDPLTYVWTLTSKPAGSAAALSSATSEKPAFTADVAGTYVASLIANDGKANSSQATVAITASPLVSADFGKVTTKIEENSHVRVILTQSDGKILAAGNAVTSGNQDFAVVRYNQDGSLDTSFAGTGIVRTNIAGRIQSTDWVRGAAIQTDGKIIVAGYTAVSGDPASSIALVRYNQDGSIDSSFGGNGIVTTTDSLLNFIASSVALQTDGKIVVAGSANLYNRFTPGYGTLLIRYNSDGSIDSSFGQNGIKIDTSTLGVQSIALQTDGKILAAGSRMYTGSSTSNVFALARYNSDGNLDSTFAGNGIVTTEIGTAIGSTDSGSAVAVQTDGRILVAGVSYSSTSRNDFAVVRYLSNGSLDTSFGVGGKLTTDFAAESDFANAIAVQPNGKIVVAGERTSVRSNPMPFPGFYMAANIDFAVVRYNSNGSLDSSFAVNGKATTDFGLLTDTGYAIALQSDGSILVSGSSQTYVGPDAYTSFATARYLTNGSLDPTFRNR